MPTYEVPCPFDKKGSTSTAISKIMKLIDENKEEVNVKYIGLSEKGLLIEGSEEDISYLHMKGDSSKPWPEVK